MHKSRSLLGFPPFADCQGDRLYVKAQGATRQSPSFVQHRLSDLTSGEFASSVSFNLGDELPLLRSCPVLIPDRTEAKGGTATMTLTDHFISIAGNVPGEPHRVRVFDSESLSLL